MLSRRLLRLKVIKSLYAHIKSDAPNLQASAKNLVVSIDKTYELYFKMLWLAVDIARYAEERQEIARRKKLPTYEDLNPNRKFIENTVIARIAESEAVCSFMEKHSLGGSQRPELIKNIYSRLSEADYFKKYMASSERTFKEDLQLLIDFYTRELEDDEALEDALEDESIFWSDYLGFAHSMVVRTLQGMREAHTEIKLLPQFKSTDDLAFAKMLFEKAALQFERNCRFIDGFTSNWDVDRIAFMDILIMSTALTEITDFPSIPVKVSLDEYIEISKFYSTQSSSHFINGVLDKAVETLRTEGKIIKTGRGLI